jgi:hypothetical protein
MRRTKRHAPSVWGGEPEMAGNADVIIALDQKRMEATVKQDFATLESIITDDLISRWR